MIKDFFIKKENIFISLIALISIFCVVLGFLFLFFKTESKQGPRVIPNTIESITWEDFSSDILEKSIEYPEYMYVQEQKDETGVGLNISEFEPKEFLTYFSKQNHVSLYPSGIDNQLFYAKTKKSDYKSTTGQEFVRTEYFTTVNQVWAVMLVPKVTPTNWQSRGFIWIQSDLKNKEVLCMSDAGTLITPDVCDPYAKELPVYKGDVSKQFISFGYAIINKNSF